MNDVLNITIGLSGAIGALKALVNKFPSTEDDVNPAIQACMDAIEVLKEPEHGDTFTVIDMKTGKEADEYNIALHEDWAKHLCYCDMDGWAIQADGSLLLLDECGRYAYADRERFKVKWE